MVTFTRIPYEKAAKRARVQDRIIYGSLVAVILVLIGLLAFAFT